MPRRSQRTAAAEAEESPRSTPALRSSAKADADADADAESPARRTRARTQPRGEHSSTLFRGKDGAAMRFRMGPCEHRRRVRTLLEEGGGEMTGDTTNSVALALPGAMVRVGKRVYSYEYVIESCKANTLLDLEDYRIGPKEKAVVAVGRSRKEYTDEEDAIILKYVHGRAALVGALAWQRAQEELVKLGVDHPWSSIYNRYRKVLVKRPPPKTGGPAKLPGAKAKPVPADNESQRKTRAGGRATASKSPEAAHPSPPEVLVEIGQVARGADTEAEEEAAALTADDEDEDDDDEHLMRVATVREPVAKPLPVHDLQDVVGVRRRGGRREFEVLWKDGSATWEREAALPSILIVMFLRKADLDSAAEEPAAAAASIAPATTPTKTPPPARKRKRTKQAPPSPDDAEDDEDEEEAVGHAGKRARHGAATSVVQDVRDAVAELVARTACSKAEVFLALHAFSGAFDDAHQFLQTGFPAVGSSPWTPGDDRALGSHDRATLAALKAKHGRHGLAARYTYAED